MADISSSGAPYARISPSNLLGSDLQRSIHQFKTFNDDFFKRGSSTSTYKQNSPLFSRLAFELRLKIWTTYLQRHRFLRMTIISFQADSGFHPSQPSNNENAPRDQQYRVCVRNLPSPCALFGVCHEAAQAWREFCRVRLPCYLATSKGLRERAGFALLNPEWDILDIHSHNLDDDHTLELIHFFQT